MGLTINDVSPVNRLLSDISVAYRQDMPAVSDIVFPRVTVDLQTGTYFTWNKADRWRRQTFKRAPGDVFKRGALNNGTDTYRAEQHAMEYKLPDEIRTTGARNGIGWDNVITSSLQEQLVMAKDLDFAADFMTSGSGWQSGTLGAGKWSAANSTPVKDVVAAARLIKRTIGSNRNYRLVGIGGTIVESARLANADISDRMKYVQTTGVDSIRDFIAAALGISQFIVVDREYTTSKEGQAAVYAPVVDDDFLLLAVPSAPGMDMPAAGYTFEWDDGTGTSYIEEYRDETVKSDIYRAIEYYDQKQVDANLGVFFGDAVD
jgi:hypothetical protein